MSAAIDLAETQDRLSAAILDVLETVLEGGFVLPIRVDRKCKTTMAFEVCEQTRVEPFLALGVLEVHTTAVDANSGDDQHDVLRCERGSRAARHRQIRRADASELGAAVSINQDVANTQRVNTVDQPPGLCPPYGLTFAAPRARRMGVLLKDVPERQGQRTDLERKADIMPPPTRKEPGGRPPKNSDGRPPELSTRADVAERAGLSVHQSKQALAVAAIPEKKFERLIEAEKPATLTERARPTRCAFERGRRPRSMPPRRRSAGNPGAYKLTIHAQRFFMGIVKKAGGPTPFGRLSNHAAQTVARLVNGGSVRASSARVFHQLLRRLGYVGPTGLEVAETLEHLIAAPAAASASQPPPPQAA